MVSHMRELKPLKAEKHILNCGGVGNRLAGSVPGDEIGE